LTTVGAKTVKSIFIVLRSTSKLCKKVKSYGISNLASFSKIV
jgi:hypothetical protein